jgi:hypothetical protein
MNETPEQYSQRLLNNVGDRNPIDVMESTIAKLQAVAQNMRTGRWNKKLSSESWTAAKILSHLAEGEIVFAYRIRRALNSSGEAIEAYDQNDWVQNATYLQEDPELALTLFQTVRKANIARMNTLTPEQWERFGIHSERGNESIRRMAQLAAGHDLNHLKQLESIAKLEV